MKLQIGLYQSFQVDSENFGTNDLGRWVTLNDHNSWPFSSMENYCTEDERVRISLGIRKIV